jgi:hypothetical protein
MLITGVGVEKVTSISGMRFSRSMLEGSIDHALFDSDRRRPADVGNAFVASTTMPSILHQGGQQGAITRRTRQRVI